MSSDGLNALTHKEIEVLDLVALGHTNDQIAGKLFISETTVRTHLRSVNLKFHTSSRTQAVATARRLGFIR